MKYFNGHSDLFTAIHYRRLEGETDIFKRHYYENFKKGGVGGAIFVIWTDEAHQDDYQAWVKGMLETSKKTFEEEADVLSQVKTGSDLDLIGSDQRVHALLGMEGLASLKGDVDLLDQLYEDYGVRHAGLTWNEENEFAKGPRFAGGLSQAGIQALRRLEELGIAVDLSHLNDDGFWDVMKYATKPLMASHSNARALANHPRNLTDDMLRALRDQGGIVGLNSARDFISDNKDDQELPGLVRVLDHLIQIMGTDQVAFGFDFMEFLPFEAQGSLAPPPGESSAPLDLQDESDVPKLIEAMKELRLSENEIEAIGGKNMIRHLKEVL